MVCVKTVPSIEEKVELNDEERDIRKENLVFEINEWDSYALEEAVLIKERMGGTVTVATVGSEETRLERLLRECFARGADEAVMVADPVLRSADGMTTAKILQRLLEDMSPDLVLTGVQSSDYGYFQVGLALAQLLNMPHVSTVTSLDLEDDAFVAEQELEGGLYRVVRTKIPSLFAIQTGINTPRYPSLLKIRVAMRKEIKTLELAELGISEADIRRWSAGKIRKMYFPKSSTEVEFIEGTSEEIVAKLSEVVARLIL
ncbi:MAG: electron transfer flavoprotein subunit beta/FixA family protein [Candidatus Geothermarchaeales archaeon]